MVGILVDAHGWHIRRCTSWHVDILLMMVGMA
jgi:hypothetical protein